MSKMSNVIPSTRRDNVQFQPPDEVINKDMISLLCLYDFVDTIVDKDIYVIKERNTWSKSVSHDPFEFRLRNYCELSNYQYLIEFSVDNHIEYNKDKFHLKGYIMSEYRRRNGDCELRKRYMFDLHNKMFSIYLPDKSIVIFDLDESPVFTTGSVSIKIDYYNYNRYL